LALKNAKAKKTNLSWGRNGNETLALKETTFRRQHQNKGREFGKIFEPPQEGYLDERLPEESQKGGSRVSI